MPSLTILLPSAGNICRSPTAEAMFKSVVEKAGLADTFDIDSCGTGAKGQKAGGWVRVNAGPEVGAMI